MVLISSEINCTLLKDRLKSGQNCTENQPLGTPKGLISRTRLKNGSWTWNFDILHKSTRRLCVPILSEIGRPSFPSLPRSLRQKLLKGKALHPLYPEGIRIYKCWFLGSGEENRRTRRKTLGARERINNKINQHVTPGPRALANAPSLLPFFLSDLSLVH